YENLKVDIGSFASDEIKNFVTDNATFNQFKLSSRWSRVTLNRGIFATRGSSQSLGMDVAVPGSDAPYAKVTYDAQKYVPLGPLTFRLSTTMGIGQSLDSEKRLPFFENYYGGGFGSVRGFERSPSTPEPCRAS
ncbi:MAG: BamA/TamA family outer membrane protein, partial [Pseudomonadales bacterium]